MKSLLSPLKRIIFLSFILFTVFAGKDGCKCGNNSNSSSSSSSQGNGNSSGGQFSASGSAHQGGNASMSGSNKGLSGASKNSNSTGQPSSVLPASPPHQQPPATSANLWTPGKKLNLVMQIPPDEVSEGLEKWIYAVYKARNKKKDSKDVKYPSLPQGENTDKKHLIKIILENMQREKFPEIKPELYDFYVELLHQVNEQLYKKIGGNLIEDVMGLIKEDANQVSTIDELVEMMGNKNKEIVFEIDLK